MNEVVIRVDGAARGNPGPAAIAAIMQNKWGETLTTISRRIGISTNNQAEYRAIILGLQEAIAMGTRVVEVKSDSELVVRQICSRYRVSSPDLLPLYQQVKQLENSLVGFSINHIPREENSEANDLVNRTLNLVRHIGYAQVCQLIIRLRQSDNENSDIHFLHRLIDILKSFPGLDPVELSISSRDKHINLKLSNMRVHYCYELREQLKCIVGKRGIIVKQLE